MELNLSTFLVFVLLYLQNFAMHTTCSCKPATFNKRGILFAADEASSFARTQSFSAKIMKTTQGFARKFSSSSTRSVTDGGRESRDISSISETPDSSPGESRKSSAEGNDTHRQSSVNYTY